MFIILYIGPAFRQGHDDFPWLGCPFLFIGIFLVFLFCALGALAPFVGGGR